jgi:C4-dicarboxylate-specific signal transduction histidine kinase
MKRLLGFGIVALAIVATMLFITNTIERDRAIAEADNARAARAKSFASAVDRTLQARMVEAFTFAALPSLRGFASAEEQVRPARAAVARVELFAIQAADPNIRAAAIVDTNGSVIMTTDQSMLANWSERDFVRQALRGQLVASAPLRDTDETTQVYSSPILNNQGEVAGAIVLHVSAQELWDALDAQSGLMVVDDLGVRIADQSAEPQVFVALAPLPSEMVAQTLAEMRYGAEIKQIRATSLPELATAVKRREVAKTAYRDSRGQTIRASLQRITTNPWTMVLSESEEAILAPTHRALLEQIGIASLAMIVLGGAISAAYYLNRLDEKKK